MHEKLTGFEAALKARKPAPPAGSAARDIFDAFPKARLETEPGLLRRRLAAIRANRLGREHEVAAMFLATTDAYLLGRNLVIDGRFVSH